MIESGLQHAGVQGLRIQGKFRGGGVSGFKGSLGQRRVEKPLRGVSVHAPSHLSH